MKLIIISTYLATNKFMIRYLHPRFPDPIIDLILNYLTASTSFVRRAHLEEYLPNVLVDIILSYQKLLYERFLEYEKPEDVPGDVVMKYGSRYRQVLDGQVIDYDMIWHAPGGDYRERLLMKGNDLIIFRPPGGLRAQLIYLNGKIQCYEYNTHCYYTDVAIDSEGQYYYLNSKTNRIDVRDGNRKYLYSFVIGLDCDTLSISQDYLALGNSISSMIRIYRLGEMKLSLLRTLKISFQKFLLFEDRLIVSDKNSTRVHSLFGEILGYILLASSPWMIVVKNRVLIGHFAREDSCSSFIIS